MVVCLELGANNVHVVQLLPLLLYLSIYPGSTGKEVVRWVCFVQE